VPSHHFENVGPDPTEENRLHQVECIYCKQVDTRNFTVMDVASPRSMAARIYAARAIPPDADCPNSPDEAP
jgi:hypothetical protein